MPAYSPSKTGGHISIQNLKPDHVAPGDGHDRDNAHGQQSAFSQFDKPFNVMKRFIELISGEF